MNLCGNGAAATPGQGTYAGTACGTDAHASLGYCLVAMSFLSGTVGYGLSAPGPAGSPFVVGRTTDAGISWSSVGQVPGLASAAPGQPHLLFTGSTTGFAWGQGNLERTTDGGARWTKVRLRGRFLSLVGRGRSLWARPRPVPPHRPSPRRSGVACASPTHVMAGRRGRPSRFPQPHSGRANSQSPASHIDLAAWEPANNRSGSASRLLIGSARGTAWTSSPLPCPSQDQFPGELTAAPGSSTLWLVCQRQADTGVALYQSSNGGSGWVEDLLRLRSVTARASRSTRNLKSSNLFRPPGPMP